jgi:hypothetical protein
VLKASTKRPSADDDPGDPIEMLRLRGPFDPLALLSAEAVVELHNQLTSQLSSLLDAGGLERADLSDVFYYRNRIPNWLGALTQAQAFEAQSVMPLSSPALVRAAFRLTAAERRSELIHFLVLSRLAPDLLELPFAMHSWSESLLEHTPELTIAPPVVVPAGTHTRVFGSWQYSINQNANLRPALANLVEDASGLGVWDWVDRNRLLALLRTKEFSFLEILSLLGLLPLILFEAGRSRQVPIGESTPSWSLPRPSLSYRGSVDVIRGPGSLRFRKRRRRRSTAKVAATGSISLEGWARCEQLPGARVAVELVAEDGAVLARVPANRMRHDLARAGSTDGRHAFCLLIDAQDVRQVIERNGGRCRCTVRVVESAFTLTHGDLVFRCP